MQISKGTMNAILNFCSNGVYMNQLFKTERDERGDSRTINI